MLFYFYSFKFPLDVQAWVVTSPLFFLSLQVTTLASLVLRLPYGTLGDMFMLVAVQLVVRGNS
jgi:hypothetical protein